MVICVCNDVRSSELLEALQRTGNLELACEELGIGTGCGTCLKSLDNLAMLANTDTKGNR